MTISSNLSVTTGDDSSGPKPVEYHYDLRLEIGVPEGSDKISVVAIFRDFANRMKAAADVGTPFVILTATDRLYFEGKDMSSEEFQKAFQVDHIEGKAAKVLLGFKLRTMTKLSELKKRLMHTYLIPCNLFLREHVGGFDNGVKTYSYGFLKGDHPDHPDTSVLSQRFARHISDSWKKLDKEDRKKWRQQFPNLFFGTSGIMLPLTFTKERIVTKFGDKEKLGTNALMVSTPAKYGKLMKVLLDIAVFNKKINNLIPFALNRENPEGYYYLLAEQARFIENHRNIPIMNIPLDAVNKPGTKGQKLLDILNGNAAIQRVAYDPKQHKYHVSTVAAKYREVHQWITSVLQENCFSYEPHIRPMKYGNGTIQSTSYSTIFQDAVSIANTTYDASTIKTTQSNAWKNRPPLNISYVPTDEAFPLLPQPKKSVPVTPSTASETFDEDTIQSAISTAIKKLEEQHQAELSQLKLEFQQKLDAVEHQMKNLADQVVSKTYQALVKDESPLVTKADHAHLQHEISVVTSKLTTIIELFQNSKIPLPPTDIVHTTPYPSGEPLPPSFSSRTTKRPKPTLSPIKMSVCEDMYTQEKSVSSATSDPDEGMEGCDD